MKRRNLLKLLGMATVAPVAVKAGVEAEPVGYGELGERWEWRPPAQVAKVIPAEEAKITLGQNTHSLSDYVDSSWGPVLPASGLIEPGSYVAMDAEGCVVPAQLRDRVIGRALKAAREGELVQVVTGGVWAK